MSVISVQILQIQTTQLISAAASSGQEHCSLAALPGQMTLQLQCHTSAYESKSATQVSHADRIDNTTVQGQANLGKLRPTATVASSTTTFRWLWKFASYARTVTRVKRVTAKICLQLPCRVQAELCSRDLQLLHHASTEEITIVSASQQPLDCHTVCR